MTRALSSSNIGQHSYQAPRLPVLPKLADIVLTKGGNLTKSPILSPDTAFDTLQ